MNKNCNKKINNIKLLGNKMTNKRLLQFTFEKKFMRKRKYPGSEI